VTERQLDDRSAEFPRIDDRLAGLRGYRIIVGRGSLIRYDLYRNTLQKRRFDAGQNRGEPGEAVFVPAGKATDESAGWYLSYVYDPIRDGCDLVIIDASDFTGEPVARVRLRQPGAARISR
jgi:carotenoid cleavage dioxygenase-like enzyme